MINFQAIRVIYKYEMLRAWNTLLQTIASPVISTSLYFVVFGAAIGSRIEEVEGVSYGVFIVPGVLYVQMLRVPKEVFVQAMGLLLLVVSLSLGLALSRHDLYSADHAFVSGLCVLPAFFGLYLGGRIRAQLSEANFSTLIYIALAAFGAYLILGAFVNLP